MAGITPNRLQTMTLPRSEYEFHLARSLSRHIGYTTGAIGIDRIAGITKNFERKPSIYQYELVQSLMNESDGSERQLGEKYATGIVNFATALGIVYKAADGPTHGAKRFALTSEGRTVKSAFERNEDALLRYTLLGLVLEYDCDIYGLVLDILYDEPISGPKLHALFKTRFESLREDRLTWLADAFPNRTIRDLIAAKTPWITSKIKPLSIDFARHHVTPRLGWAKRFGHIDAQWPSSKKVDGRVLTDQGIELLRAIRGQKVRYEWLGPNDGTQDALGVPKSKQREGPFGPSWNLLRPSNVSCTQSDVDRLAEDVEEFTRSHYDDLKLVHANQVSIDSVLPFLHLREHEVGYSVERISILDRIAKSRTGLNVLSSRQDRYGYFQRLDR